MSRNELAGDVLAGCSGNVVQLWQRQTYAEATVSHTSSVKCVAWNRNNKVVASGCQDGVIQLCYSTGKLMSVLRGVDGASLGSLNSLDWSMGSKFLAAGSDNGSVFVWDLKVSKVGGQGCYPAAGCPAAHQAVLSAHCQGNLARIPGRPVHCKSLWPCLLYNLSDPCMLSCASAPCRHCRATSP